MSWTHSSKAVALGVLLAVAVTTAGIAGAVSFEGNAPESAEAGEEITVEVTMEDLFAEQPDSWTLQADTELENPDWTLEVRDPAGDEVVRQDIANESITQDLSVDNNHVEVFITVEGTVPEMSTDTFNYENVEQENITTLELSQVVEDGTSQLEGGVWTTHRYNQESQEARQAIDNATTAVEEANSEDANKRLTEAITFYNNGEFASAIEAANDAQDTAESEGETQQLLIMLGAVVLLVAILGGGFYYWRQSQQDTSKLQ